MNTNILQRQLKKRYRLTPPQVLAIFFFVIIISGALLLMLPQATVQSGSLNFIDALFTSTSAVCVTGLVVVDTGTAFTTLGKVIVIALIQCGGLGIMTFASIVYVFLRRKMSMANMLVMREALNQNSMSYLSKTVLWIIQMTVAIEAAGAFLLSFRFIPMYGALKGTFYSVFHSISAFCNAGFDINSGQFTSIMEFVGDPLVVLTISALIILGGTGFAVIHEFIIF
ncbi:MAG: Trk family potassium uptake protein, partial [Clostridia bacterium]|nr:Trk family potassium uptake protein [Clostridia bacterium]